MTPLATNLIIGILIIAAVCTYILILRKINRNREPSKVSKTKIRKRKARKRREVSIRMNVKKAKVAKPPKLMQADEQGSNCPFYVGYLGTLTSGSETPINCLKCPDITICTKVSKQIKKGKTKGSRQ